MVSVLIEVRPLIRSANVSIKLANPDPERLRVEKTSISIGERTLTFTNVKFDPLSLRNVETKGNFLYFNVKIEDFHRESMEKWRLAPPVLPNTTVNLSCICSEILVENLTFSRVLPLPSEPWDDSEAFCRCHYKPNGKNDCKEQTVNRFRVGDCLFSTHFFHMSEELLPNFTSNAMCPKCEKVFGKKSSGYYKIWNASITFSENDKNVLQDFYAILYEILSDPLAIFAKILLESEGKFLAITILEKDLFVFQSTGSDSVLKPKSMLKVGFSYHLGETGCVKQWQRDSSVHCIEVGEVLFQTVKTSLETIHETLHPKFNKIGEQCLAYVPYRPS